MKPVVILAALLGALIFCSPAVEAARGPEPVEGPVEPLRAEEDAPPSDGVIRPGQIHRPQDVAPPELVIVPRCACDYRPPGTLLATALHQAVRVDADELLRRKYDCYDGKLVNSSLPTDAGPVLFVPAGALTENRSTDDRNLAVITWWIFITGCVVTTAWLLTRTFRNWLRPQNLPR